jgi:hypothetical protein
MARPGRPTLYKPNNAELARKFCLLGATNDDMADCFEVACRTIDDWIASVPEFGAGVREGRAVADGRVARGRYDHAIGDQQALGRTAPDNTAYGVLLFSRPFIPVRKNYLTQRALPTLIQEVRHLPTRGLPTRCRHRAT